MSLSAASPPPTPIEVAHLLQDMFADDGRQFFLDLGKVSPGACPAGQQLPLARQVLFQFDRLRFLARKYLGTWNEAVVLHDEAERAVWLHLERSYLGAEPYRDSPFSPYTRDWLSVVINAADGRRISVDFGFHLVPLSQRTWRQKMAGIYPSAISRWMEVPWPEQVSPPTRRAVEVISADPDGRNFLQRRFYWVEDWQDLPYPCDMV